MNTRRGGVVTDDGEFTEESGRVVNLEYFRRLVDPISVFCIAEDSVRSSGSGQVLPLTYFYGRRVRVVSGWNEDHTWASAGVERRVHLRSNVGARKQSCVVNLICWVRIRRSIHLLTAGRRCG